MLIMYDAFTSMNYTLDERRLATALGGGGSGGGGVSYMPDGTTITLDASGLLTVNPNLFYSKSELDAKLSARWRWKGTADTINDLPTSDNEVGDTYTVRDAGDGISNAEYGWDGSKWEFIGPTLDMSGYALTETVKELIKAHADDYTSHVTLADRQAWDRATVDLENHIAEASKHVSSDERAAWNAKADASLVTAETTRATSAEQELRAAIQNVDNNINFSTLIDKIWIYGNGVYDLNKMVKPGMYYCSKDANVVGGDMLNMPNLTSEGCLLVLKNSQIFWEGGTAKGRVYYRYQTGAGPVVTEYTEEWCASAMMSDVRALSGSLLELTDMMNNNYWKHATVDDLADKVDKVDGKGLSQEDFTTEYKNRIHALESELALLKEQGVGGGGGSVDPQLTQVSFIGGTSEEPQMLHLDVGKIYVATGPFRAILPVNPPNGSVIRLSVETGMEEMWVDATEETTISGTKQEVAAGMTPEGLLINNATYQFVFNAAANNWIVF